MQHSIADCKHPRFPFWKLELLLILTLCGCSKKKSTTAQANDLFLQAQTFIAAGDTQKALDALNQSIALQPAVWAYHERAKLYAQLGDEKSALADCDAALKLDPGDPDAAWLKGEFAKPAAERFRGKFKTPPSSNH